MSFFGKLKQGLGIGGVKVVLDMPPEASKDEGIIKGAAILTTKSSQHVKGIKFIVREIMTSGDDVQNRRQEEFKLGDSSYDQEFDIQPGEEKRIDFTLPFSARRTFSENLSQQGGVVGALGKVGTMMDDRRSRFYVVAQADVVGTLAGASVTKAIHLA